MRRRATGPRTGRELRAREIAALRGMDRLYDEAGGCLASPALAGYAARLHALENRSGPVVFAAHPRTPDHLVGPGLVCCDDALWFHLDPDDTITALPGDPRHAVPRNTIGSC